MSATLLTPRRFADERGWFMETFHDRRYRDLGVEATFIQDNHSFSAQAGTIRGIHFQRMPHAQAKLVRCLSGRIFDVAVDLRKGSPSFGRHVAVELSAENGHQLFIPAGFGHAFMTLEPDCEVAYKVDAHYAPETEGGVRWDDPGLMIDWPLTGAGIATPIVSAKDAILPWLRDIEVDFNYDGKPLLPTLS